MFDPVFVSLVVLNSSQGLWGMYTIRAPSKHNEGRKTCLAVQGVDLNSKQTKKQGIVGHRSLVFSFKNSRSEADEKKN